MRSTASGLRDVDLLACRKGDNSLFPVGAPAEISTSLALLLAFNLSRVDCGNLLLEESLNRVLDLDLVRGRCYAEDVLV